MVPLKGSIVEAEVDRNLVQGPQEKEFSKENQSQWQLATGWRRMRTLKEKLLLLFSVSFRTQKWWHHSLSSPFLNVLGSDVDNKLEVPFTAEDIF